MFGSFRQTWLGYPFARGAIVNLKSGKSFRGILWDSQGGFLVLREAHMLQSNQNPVKLDGELCIPSAEVDFIQVVGAHPT